MNRPILATKTMVIICLLGMMSFISCKKDKDKVTYPYTEFAFLHLGNKTGLTPQSSDKVFLDGLKEVVELWSKSNSSESETVFNGVAYEITNFREATGAVPNYIWDSFWEELDKYSHSVGSCWALSEVKLPSRKGIGNVYVLYAIVVKPDDEVLYIALRGNAIPKQTSKGARYNQFDSAKEIEDLFDSILPRLKQAM